MFKKLIYWILLIINFFFAKHFIININIYNIFKLFL